MESLNWSSLEPHLTKIGVFIMLAIAGYIVTKLISRFCQGLSRRFLSKKKADSSAIRFLNQTIDLALKAVFIICLLSYLGVQTSAILAVFGSAGLAIGLALQGSLSNVAGGVLILVLRPFRTGHFIEAMGLSGTVSQIGIFSTELTTADNRVINLPNGPLAGSAITNFSAKDTRRVDLVFGISYGDDISEAKSIISNVLNDDSRILQDPAIFIGITELGASSVDLVLRAWVKSENYWPVSFDLKEKIKLAFDKKGISIPFPQQEILIKKEE